MSGFTLDEGRLKAMAIALWRQGGGDTLVKVMPKGSTPDPTRMIGYCTTFKYVVGRTPVEMEANVGFAAMTKLAAGAEVFLVRPLPMPGQFLLKGYSQTPGGVSTSDPAYRGHPDYPPGQGVPQWDLHQHSQAHLVHLATVPPGQRFVHMTATLPRPI